MKGQVGIYKYLTTNLRDGIIYDTAFLDTLGSRLAAAKETCNTFDSLNIVLVGEMIVTFSRETFHEYVL